jgi:hypothetical protein
MGRLLKRAEEIGLIADYTGDLIELNDALEMTAHAEVFVAAMKAVITTASE